MIRASDASARANSAFCWLPPDSDRMLASMSGRADADPLPPRHGERPSPGADRSGRTSVRLPSERTDDVAGDRPERKDAVRSAGRRRPGPPEPRPALPHRAFPRRRTGAAACRLTMARQAPPGPRYRPGWRQAPCRRSGRRQCQHLLRPVRRGVDQPLPHYPLPTVPHRRRAHAADDDSAREFRRPAVEHDPAFPHDHDPLGGAQHLRRMCEMRTLATPRQVRTCAGRTEAVRRRSRPATMSARPE